MVGYMNPQDTSGFYKIENAELFYGHSFVYGSGDGDLLRENKDNYEYPVNGWYWFDDESAARVFFNLPPIPPLPPV